MVGPYNKGTAVLGSVLVTDCFSALCMMDLRVNSNLRMHAVLNLLCHVDAAAHASLLLQLHPLSVRLDVCPSAQASDRQLATTLTFYYYTQLKLVGVLAASPEDQELITNLFLGDVGDGLMLENVGVCSSSGTLQFAEAGRPCPFRYVAA